MYDVRINRIKEFVNYLLIVISFLSAISIALFIKEENLLFLIPLLLQFFTLLLLFKTFFSESIVHWFEYKETFKSIEEKNLNRDLFSILKTLENWTGHHQKSLSWILEFSLILIVISIYLIGYFLIGIYFKEIAIFIFRTIFTILIISILLWYKKIPKYNWKKENEKMQSKFDEWVNKNPKKS